MAPDKLYPAQELAKLSGLTPSYVYYLVANKIIRPAVPGKFNEDALRVIRIFVRLQKKRVGPKALVKLLNEAVGTYVARIVREKVGPRRQQIEEGTKEVWNTLEEARRATYRDGISQEEWQTAFFNALKQSNLMHNVARYSTLDRLLTQESYALVRISKDDPAWDILNPIFRDRQERDEFLELLTRTGALPEITGLPEKGRPELEALGKPIRVEQWDPLEEPVPAKTLRTRGGGKRR